MNRLGVLVSAAAQLVLIGCNRAVLPASPVSVAGPTPMIAKAPSTVATLPVPEAPSTVRTLPLPKRPSLAIVPGVRMGELRLKRPIAELNLEAKAVPSSFSLQRVALGSQDKFYVHIGADADSRIERVGLVLYAGLDYEVGALLLQTQGRPQDVFAGMLSQFKGCSALVQSTQVNGMIDEDVVCNGVCISRTAVRPDGVRETHNIIYVEVFPLDRHPKTCGD